MRCTNRRFTYFYLLTYCAITVAVLLEEKHRWQITVFKRLLLLFDGNKKRALDARGYCLANDCDKIEERGKRRRRNNDE